MSQCAQPEMTIQTLILGSGNLLNSSKVKAQRERKEHLLIRQIMQPKSTHSSYGHLRQALLKHEGQPCSPQCRKEASADRHFSLSEVDLEVAEKSELVLGLLFGTGGHVDRHRGKRRQHVTRSTSGKLPKCSQGLRESLQPCAHGTKRRSPPCPCPTRIALVPGRASVSQGTQTNSTS